MNASDYLIRHRLMAELNQELLGAPQVDGSRGAPIYDVRDFLGVYDGHGNQVVNVVRKRNMLRVEIHHEDAPMATSVTLQLLNGEIFANPRNPYISVALFRIPTTGEPALMVNLSACRKRSTRYN